MKSYRQFESQNGAIAINIIQRSSALLVSTDDIIHDGCVTNLQLYIVPLLF